MKHTVGALSLIVAALVPGVEARGTIRAAPLPTVLGADLPSAESAPPSATEWSGGRRVAPTRGSAELCELTLVREWLRIRCPGMVGAGLVAGSARGVSVRVLGRLFVDGMDGGDAAAIVVLPLRPGDARIVAFDNSASEYDGATLTESGVLSVLWRADRPYPVLVMRGFPKVLPRAAPGIGPE